MLPFHVLCPQIAADEVRTLTLEKGSLPEFDIPADTYGFLEFFCEKKGCDCRRVLLSVIAESSRSEVARISHAFDPPEAKTDGSLEQTFLEPYGARQPYAEALLVVFKKAVLDDAYSEQLQRHYRIFKELLETHENISEAALAAAPDTAPRTPGPNQPCPCGSGKKYKKCCGRS